MFMNTSLAHYQLPLFGLTTPTLATEIGADQRSVFLRPITAAGAQPTTSWPATVAVQDTDLVPKEYRNWLAQVTNYKDATGGSASSSTPTDDDTAEGGEAEAAADSGASSDTGGAGGTQAAAGNGGTNNSQNGTSSSANSGSGNGSSGGLVGWLLG